MQFFLILNENYKINGHEISTNLFLKLQYPFIYNYAIYIFIKFDNCQFIIVDMGSV